MTMATPWRRGQAIGQPASPSREQTARLRTAAESTRKEMLPADEKGGFHLQCLLAPWSMVLIKQVT